MNYDTLFSARASLMLVGRQMQQMGIWKTIQEQVVIQQKTIQHHPLDKLKDCFIGILAGGHGLVEINTRVRPDRALQVAFGRETCADQSTVSTTLDRCTEENVAQLRQALMRIYRQHSQGYRHDYTRSWQVLDIDLSGMPAGRQGEGVTKGYFSGRPNCRGRQLGRVLATQYEEIVTEALYEGRKQLNEGLQGLVQQAEVVLALDEERRPRTLLRLDSGGGQDKQVNWLLGRGYALLVKMHCGNRAAKMARTVTEWIADPKEEGREIGWIPQPHPYVCPTRQVAVRVPKAGGEYAYGVLICRAPDELIRQLLDGDWDEKQPHAELFGMVHAYDRRGGGVETQFKGDKQGLGLTKRNKQWFAAQEMLMLLAQLAHNLVIWVRRILIAVYPKFKNFGILRMVRDIFQIPGKILLDAQGRLVAVTLNQHYPMARYVAEAFSTSKSDLLLNLGEI